MWIWLCVESILICINQYFIISLLSNNKEVASKHVEASAALTEMHLWKEVTDRRGNPAYLLNQTFVENLKVAIFGG